MVPEIQPAPGLILSRIVHGQMRLSEWNLSPEALYALVQTLMEWGITTFDHADIYGNYTCEARFGEMLRHHPEIRPEIQLVTKCGIRLLTDHNPGLKIKHYEYSREHILASVHQSLQNFHTDYIDLLLLHRPAPFFQPEDVAFAFDQLKHSGKVRFFGVSNFTPGQFDMLQSYLDFPLVTNQIEISPWNLEHFDNGNMDFCLKKRMNPMAWSPLAGGKGMQQGDEKSQRLRIVFEQLCTEYEVREPEKMIYAWLLTHPAGILPVCGSGRPERIRFAAEAMNIQLSTEDWYRVYNASKGIGLP